MPLTTVIGLLAALIGSTATVLAAWIYIRSQRPPKRELLRSAFTVTIIMVSILGLALLISRATNITINGREMLPLPSSPGTGQPFPSPALTPTPSPSPTSTPTPSPSPTLTPVPSPSPTSIPSPTPTPSKAHSTQ